MEVVLGRGPDAIADKPVYVVVMTGRFSSYRGGMGPEPLPHVAPHLVVIFDATTMELNGVSLREQDPRERLSRLGPVTQLAPRP
jgi:hypothetical protein